MTDLTQPTPDAIEQDAGPQPLPSDLSLFLEANDAQLDELIRRTGLYMNAGQLRLCLAQLQKAHEAPTADAIRLLDALCEQYAVRAEAQTLMGFDTNDPDHADALSTLICHCRDAAARRATPPLQLRTVLNAVQSSLSAAQPLPPYDRDASLHFTLCDAVAAAATSTPTATMHIAGSSLQLLCHNVQKASRSAQSKMTDRLCFVYTANEQPTAAQCGAASTLFARAQEQGIIRTVLPVAPHMLLPGALSCAGRGLTIDASHLPTVAPDRAPQPADIVSTAHSGWLLRVAADKTEALQQLAASLPLTVAPFAALRKDQLVEFALLSGEKPTRIPVELLRSMEFAMSYRLTDDRPASSAPSSTPAYTTPLLLQDGYSRLADEHGCKDWYVRATTVPLGESYCPDAFERAISTLQQALREDGCTNLHDAALACGWEISPALSRNVLWQNVLQLYHVLQGHPTQILPIALQHTEAAHSQCVLCMICHKAQPDPQLAPHKAQQSAPSDKLPLPAECSLLHTAQPEALIVHSACTAVSNIAATLTDAGAAVRTLQLDASEECATTLADAIHAARLVLFADADEQLERVLAHRRVQYALVSLVERDGLCLAQGEAMAPVCRTGLFDAILPELPTCTPVDAFARAFPFSVGYVRVLDRPDDEPMLRPLPDELMLLREDIPVGDPMVELFRTPDATERNILAVTDTQDGTPAAVRLSTADGHLIAFADGFTPDQLQKAVQYFR
jgi:hypothetical protein